MRWHVLGAGSIGGLWASCLALAGYPVTLLLKDRLARAAFEKSPLVLESAAGIETPRVEAEVVTDFDGEPEWLLVATKSYTTLEALASLGSRLSSATKLLLLQNGIGIQQQVAEAYPRCEVIAGITTDGAWRRESFHVVFAGRGETRFGAIGRVADDTVDTLRRCLRQTRLEVQWEDDIWQPIWHKVAVNCCINALSATRRCRNGELLESEEAVATIRGLAAEVRQVMAAAGMNFDFPRLFDEVVEVIENTADNYSSTCQDVIHGRRTEIECINGFICARGAEFGVATPLNRAMLDAVRAATKA